MKTRIINAFIEETKVNGIKFTMDDLTKRLGMSKRTLYEHFSSKAEILNTIIDWTLEQFEVQTKLIIDDPSLSIIEKIKQTIQVVPEYNDFYDNQIIAQLERSYPEQWEKVNKEFNEWDELRDLLEEGIQRGEIAPHDPDLLVKLITQAVNTTLDKEFFLQQSLSVEEALNSIVEMILYGIVKKE